MKISCRFSLCILILGIFAFVSGCSEVLITKRKSLHLIPHSRIIALSSEYYSQLIAESVLSTDEEKIRMVQKVGRKITAAAAALLMDSGRTRQIRDYRWEFGIIENDRKVNAFGLPDGRVVLYSGIFDYARNEGELAVVLGHEVGHILAGHSNERLSHSLAKGRAGQKEPAFLRLVSLQEAEADRIGLLLMAKAGFDPALAIGFWKRFGKKRSARSLVQASHPDTASRIEGLENCLSEALHYYRSFEN